MKKHQFTPEFLQLADITSLYKNKGERSNLDNDRGVFNLVTIRNILDKLCYKDEYPVIDSEMSDSNIGARKNRNIRDHLFVVNGIVNDVVKGNGPPTDLQIYDISKCFDSMWFTKTINDLYDVEFRNDKLSLMSELNKKTNVAVKTPVGLTDRFLVENVIMQGGVWGPLNCSVQIDEIGKTSLQTGVGVYKYKNCIDIPPLAMIDDVTAFAECGLDFIILNTIMSTKIELNKIKLNSKNDIKCILDKKKKSLCVYWSMI